jgi:ABC-type phosphate transport system substrate-binding protein
MTFMIRVGLTLIGLALSLGATVAAAQIVTVVSTKSPVTTLSKIQVEDIFLGKASRFPDGSQAVPINLVEGSAARDEFYLTLAGKSPAQVKAHWSKIIFTGRGQPPREVSNGSELKKLVAGNPHAIGYIEQGMVDASVKVIPLK